MVGFYLHVNLAQDLINNVYNHAQTTEYIWT